MAVLAKDFSPHDVRPWLVTYVAAMFLTMAGLSAGARGVSPYLPLNLSPVIERKIEQALILADVPVLRRPIAAATVLDALPKVCERDVALCDEIKAYLSAYMRPAAVTHAAVTARVATGSDVSLPNQHGERSDSSGNVSLEAYWQPSDYLLLSAGAVANETVTAATGTLLSMGTSHAQLDIGYRDHWLSPFTDSSMLLSTEAATMPSVTLSNYEALTSLGIQYEFTLAEESHSNRIATNDGYTQGNPRIANLHLEMSPAAGWSLGVNRLLQFGGGSRGGSSISSVWSALLNPGKADNARSTTDKEEGNQQASFVSSFIYPGRTPFEVYFEYAGEDTSRFRSYLLGNSSLAAGLHIPSLWRGLDLTYEISEWQNAWWVHHIYQDGLTNQGNVVGNWGGDWRVKGDGVGASSQMVKLAYDFAGIGEFALRYRRLQNQSYSGYGYKLGQDLTLAYTYPRQGYQLGAELEFGKDVFGASYGMLSGSVRFSPGFVSQMQLSPLAYRSDVHAERFVQFGVGSINLRYDANDKVSPKSYATRQSFNLGAGARREVSAHSDLGARIEMDKFGGHTLLSVRAFDYRYRYQNHLALTGFVGATRYDGPTPALGWYFGAGAQWREIMPHVDLSIEYKTGQVIQRDHLLKNESTVNPDEYYASAGPVAYLSYKF